MIPLVITSDKFLFDFNESNIDFDNVTAIFDFEEISIVLKVDDNLSIVSK